MHRQADRIDQKGGRVMRVIASFVLVIGAVGIYAAPPPLEEFVKPPKYTGVQISPSGEYIAAALINEETGFGSFRVIRRKDNEVMVSFAMGDEKRVGAFYWAQDHMVLISPMFKVPGEDFYYPRGDLMSINVKNKDTRDLPPAAINSIWPKDPKNILVRTTDGRHPEIHKMDLRSGRKIRIARGAVVAGGNNEPAPTFVLDRDGDVVFSIGENDELGTEVYFRKGRGDWQLINTIDWGEKGWYPIAWGLRPGTFLTIDHRRATTRGIGVFNPKTGENKLLMRHPVADPSGFRWDFDGNIWAVDYDLHFPSVQYINTKHPLAKLHASLARQFPGQRVNFTSSSRDHKQVMAVISSDKNSGEYVLVDAESLSLDPIAETRPDLDSELLANMEPFELEARDGEKIYGYITMHADTPVPGPMLVSIHGGPYGARHSWGFNARNQVLATRGFHVLEVNFRGSGGYGKDYESAGYGEWGGLMQDDITDATLWAIQNKLATPGKICIGGGSYGAYSAMMGAIKEPDLYKCVIGISGVYDISIMTKSGDVRSRKSGMAYLRRMFGNKKEEQLDISPVHHADKIKATVMIVHGGLDRRTPPAHAHRMHDALRDAGKNIVWVFDPGQGHGFVGEQTNLDLWQRQLAFLNEQIGSGSEQGE